MAVDFGDPASGFHHNEVIRFINDEVLMNGGGPEFYVAFRSRSWSEVEDRLQAVVVDPQVPRSLKRACAWSALALAVRAAARQREQQMHRLQQLQEQVEEREVASWALASELQQLREKREMAAAQLHYVRAALQVTLNERDMLYQRLLQMEPSTQFAPPGHEMGLGLGAEQQHWAAAWPLNIEQRRGMVAMEAHGRLFGQMPAPTAVVSMPGHPDPWVQTVQPPLPMTVPNSVPFYPPVGFPFLLPLQPTVFMGAEAAAVPPSQPPVGIFPPGPWPAMVFQEVAPQKDNNQEASAEILQETVPPGDNTSLSQEEHPEILQEMASLGDGGSHNQEEVVQGIQERAVPSDTGRRIHGEGLEGPREMAPLEDKGNHTQGEDLVTSQGLSLLVDSECSSQEEEPGKFQGMGTLVFHRSHSGQEGPKKFQRIAPLEFRASHSQQEGPEEAQGLASLRDSRSRGIRESPRKPHTQSRKAKQLNGRTPLESQQQPALGYSPGNWDCPSCKTNNFAGRKCCFKCKRVFRPVESRCVDPGQTH
ncbi:testis-expressed protein 13D [Lepus europaeus]|uniref:testis-expressed protein 13D n=1 Tax=Lepus europaeus TaxID=9983 RepID=UPI002B460682|nr:testis-expressed protein 13D [Lepus europaeus]